MAEKDNQLTWGLIVSYHTMDRKLFKHFYIHLYKFVIIDAIIVKIETILYTQSENNPRFYCSNGLFRAGERVMKWVGC